MRKSPLIVLLLAFAMLIAARPRAPETTQPPLQLQRRKRQQPPPQRRRQPPLQLTEETTTTAADPMADWPDEIIYGFIPSERQEKLADTVQPYMDYLTETIGGPTFTGVVTADYNGLVVAMGAGNADLGSESDRSAMCRPRSSTRP